MTGKEAMQQRMQALPVTYDDVVAAARVLGAFKFRGAYNALANLTPEQKRCGVAAYSSGNPRRPWRWPAGCSESRL